MFDDVTVFAWRLAKSSRANSCPYLNGQEFPLAVVSWKAFQRLVLLLTVKFSVAKTRPGMYGGHLDLNFRFGYSSGFSAYYLSLHSRELHVSHGHKLTLLTLSEV